MRSSINLIGKLKIHEEWVIDGAGIKDGIGEYFKTLFSELFPCRPNIEGIAFDCLNTDQQRWLERPFFGEEVKVSLNSLEDDKAPSPYGFPIKFLKECW